MSAFKEVVQFALTGNHSDCDFLFRAEARNEISARLLVWARSIQKFGGFSEDKSFLIASIIGEIANNSFDHNLGKWTDQVGCLISLDFLPDRLRLAIVDRGQGIANSLKVVRPHLINRDEYLIIAFEQIVSGRAPEQRGNGLKYVRKNFQNASGLELICLSSGAKYRAGGQHNLENALTEVSGFSGTLVALDWPKESI